MKTFGHYGFILLGQNSALRSLHDLHEIVLHATVRLSLLLIIWSLIILSAEHSQSPFEKEHSLLF